MTNQSNSSSSNNAIIAYQGRPSAAVEQIMKQIVSKNSDTLYRNNNIILILWLYGNEELREEVLRDWMVEKLHRTVNEDDATDASRKNRPAARAACKEALMNINKVDDNCPIILKKLTFNLFSHYLTTRRNKKGDYLSKAGYGQIRSAFRHLYRVSGEKMGEEYETDLSQFMSGLKRTVASSRAASGQRLDEGKKGMQFEVYKKMCEILYKSDDDEHLFAHAFLTMEWNLLARSDNCFSMHVSHIAFQNGCLLFFFSKSKGNQTGEASEHPWHVYSNPQNPCLCPVLALARYLLSNPDVVKNKGLLFPGEYQYNRFMGIFHKVIERNKEVFEVLGIKEGDLGSHSCRKGAITLVSAGCTVSPPMAAICLRACWSMGPMKDRYIHYEKAGDQFVGRCATGISSLTKEFATSPVYWDLSDAPAGTMSIIDASISDNFASLQEVEGRTFKMLQFLFASICFHYNHLDANMHSQHRMRASPLFIAASQVDIQQYAKVQFPWNKTKDTPYFTGIPPHVMMMTELEALRLKLDDHKDQIVDGLREELDRRSVGGSEYQTRQVLDEVRKAHEEMISRMNDFGSNTQGAMIAEENLHSNNDYFFIDDDEEERCVGGFEDHEEDPYHSSDMFAQELQQEEGQREEVGQQQHESSSEQQEEGAQFVGGEEEDPIIAAFGSVSDREQPNSRLQTQPTPPLQTEPPPQQQQEELSRKKVRALLFHGKMFLMEISVLFQKTSSFPKCPFPTCYQCGTVVISLRIYHRTDF